MSSEILLDKKVFFLSPHPVIKEALVYMVKAGYTVYSINSKKDLMRALVSYPHSIAFINFDSGHDHEWEKYIQLIWATPEMVNIRLGMLTFYNYKKIKYAEFYITQLGIQCGFICLTSDKNVCRTLLLRILEINEAKGRRKFVRARFSQNAYFNLNYKNMQLSGIIQDISAIGMACYFDIEDVPVPEKKILDEINLVIRGLRCKVSGFIAGVRKQTDRSLYIVMFIQEKMDQTVSFRLSQSIYLQLQEDMRNELNKKSQPKEKTPE